MSTDLSREDSLTVPDAVQARTIGSHSPQQPPSRTDPATHEYNMYRVVDVDQIMSTDAGDQATVIESRRLQECCELARSAMRTTSPGYSGRDLALGRQLLTQATALRSVPGFRTTEVTVEDCLTAYYLSEANKNLGRRNSQHYHWQEALTLTESVVLRKQANQEKAPMKYEAAKVDARIVLEQWTSKFENDSMPKLPHSSETNVA